MGEWFDDVPEIDRDRVRESYNKARTLENKISILRNWHPKGHLNLAPIKNLEEYFRYIRISADNSTWFRGESREHGDLVPTLYRNIDENKIMEQHTKERKYFLEFRRRARALVPSIDPNDIWSWYFLIQHYGGPTRLLDWTHDAGIALFLALNTSRDSTDNPIVIELKPSVLTEYAFRELGITDYESNSALYPGENITELWIFNIKNVDESMIPWPRWA